MADFRPANDGSIPDEEPLYVRIYPKADSVKLVNPGVYRPVSGSLRRYPDEPLSMDRGSLCTADGTRTRGTDGNFHVAAFTAGAVRALGFRITQDPIIDGPVPNDAHVLLHGNRTDANGDHRGALTTGEYSRLAHTGRIVVWAPGWQNGQPPEVQHVPSEPDA